MAKLDYFQDSGSNYDFSDKRIPNQARSSLFDVSYVNTLTAKQGQLIPVWFSYCYPGDTFDVSIDNLVRVVNPPTVPLLSRQRVFFHLFHIDFAQLWYYWDAFMRKGWSGSYELMIPRISAPFATGSAGAAVVNPLLARGSLADYLGFNFSDYEVTDADLSKNVNLPAMPFLAYQLIYRDYYLNMPIAYQQSQADIASPFKAFFPEADQDLMIKSALVSNLTLDATSLNSDETVDGLHLGKLRYRDFAPDYFTTALPYVMRGDIPHLDANVPGESVVGYRNPLTGDIEPLQVTGIMASGNKFSTLWTGASEPYNPGSISATLGIRDGQAGVKVLGSLHSPDVEDQVSTGDAFATFNLEFTTDTFAFTQLALRQLWTDTLILEKMTRTDGTYGQFLQDFFGQTPSHWSSHRATYIGGSYQPIVYTEVLQTAPGDSGTLGTVGAKGISSASNSLGRFSCSDFGLAMVLMSIMPDTYYSQGWLKEHLYLTQEDFLLPERAILGPQPVVTGELFFNAHDDSTGANAELFGYQSRFDELRYRQNEIHGLVADDTNDSFSPYVQNRKFANAPQLNLDFLTTEDNIDNAWLSAPNEVAYIVQVANRVRVQRALPYIAPPTAIMM